MKVIKCSSLSKCVKERKRVDDKPCLLINIHERVFLNKEVRKFHWNMHSPLIFCKYVYFGNVIWAYHHFCIHIWVRFFFCWTFLRSLEVEDEHSIWYGTRHNRQGSQIMVLGLWGHQVRSLAQHELGLIERCFIQPLSFFYHFTHMVVLEHLIHGWW